MNRLFLNYLSLFRTSIPHLSSLATPPIPPDLLLSSRHQKIVDATRQFVSECPLIFRKVESVCGKEGDSEDLKKKTLDLERCAFKNLVLKSACGKSCDRLSFPSCTASASLLCAFLGAIRRHDAAILWADCFCREKHISGRNSLGGVPAVRAVSSYR